MPVLSSITVILIVVIDIFLKALFNSSRVLTVTDDGYGVGVELDDSDDESDGELLFEVPLVEVDIVAVSPEATLPF